MIQWAAVDGDYGLHVIPLDGVAHTYRCCVCGPIYRFYNIGEPDLPHLHKTVIHRSIDGSPPPLIR